MWTNSPAFKPTTCATISETISITGLEVLCGLPRIDAEITGRLRHELAEADSAGLEGDDLPVRRQAAEGEEGAEGEGGEAGGAAAPAAGEAKAEEKKA